MEANRRSRARPTSNRITAIPSPRGLGMFLRKWAGVAVLTALRKLLLSCSSEGTPSVLGPKLMTPSVQGRPFPSAPLPDLVTSPGPQQSLLPGSDHLGHVPTVVPKPSCLISRDQRAADSSNGLSVLKGHERLTQRHHCTSSDNN